MKISIISDLHLGFGQGTEMEGDSFAAFSEALEKSLDCDLIIIGGDMFDSRMPNTEVFTNAIEILKTPLSRPSETKILHGVNKNTEDFPLIKNGIPVIAIAGNHERRVKGLLNPVEALERAGFLVYLHCNSIVLENNNQKIAIHGMSSVPDQYGEQVLEAWNTKPIDGCFNVLLMHQSVAPFLYAAYLIPLEKIPKGFDLYINGHVHGTVKAEYSGAPFIIPGSLLPTQITKDLSRHSFCKVEVQENKAASVNFVELEHQREIFYKEFDKDVPIKEVQEYLDNLLKTKRNLKPIIKLVTQNKTLPVKELIEKYREDAIIYFKKDIEEETKEIEVKSILERVESVNEVGKRLLRENLQKLELNTQVFENIFELLDSNKMGEAQSLLEKMASKV